MGRSARHRVILLLAMLLGVAAVGAPAAAQDRGAAAARELCWEERALPHCRGFLVFENAFAIPIVQSRHRDCEGHCMNPPPGAEFAPHRTRGDFAAWVSFDVGWMKNTDSGTARGASVGAGLGPAGQMLSAKFRWRRWEDAARGHSNELAVGPALSSVTQDSSGSVLAVGPLAEARLGSGTVGLRIGGHYLFSSHGDRGALYGGLDLRARSAAWSGVLTGVAYFVIAYVSISQM